MRNAQYCSKRSARSNRSQRGCLRWLMCGMSWMTVPTTTSFVNPLPVYAQGEGWQGRPLVSTSIGGDSLNSLGSHGGEVADPMIEAEERLSWHHFPELVRRAAITPPDVPL